MLKLNNLARKTDSIRDVLTLSATNHHSWITIIACITAAVQKHAHGSVFVVTLQIREDSQNFAYFCVSLHAKALFWLQFAV